MVTSDTGTPSRAGRDLPVAIAVGLSLGAVILVSLFTERAVFAIGVVGVAMAIGIGELARAMSTVGMRPPVLPLWAGTAVMMVAAYRNGTSGLLFALGATVLGCLAWCIADGAKQFAANFAASIFVAVYVPFLAGFAALMAAPDDGAARVVSFIATTVCSDVGGYVAGVLKGRHPMAPTVSPKKSWEGFAGSVAACVIAGVALVSTVMEIAWWQGALFGLVVVCLATLGDLGESLLKRDIGVKDMGSLLPGHGGLMDRLDSLLLVAPVAWLLLSVWHPPA